MNIFNAIKDAIFGKAKPKILTPIATEPSAPVVATATVMDAPIDMVDVEAILTTLATTTGATLNWRTSIVDLMKLLDLDSSLTARKALADELGFKGDKNDSAAMNIWLHRQVMIQLAEHGGKVPAELRA
jgi:Domain of unknown function (DUF3597)